MIYLRQILKQPVFDKEGEQIGTISDLAIATGEVFPLPRWRSSVRARRRS